MESDAALPRADAWSGSTAIGFLDNTPDGTAFARNFHAEYFLNHQISVGPLAQLAVTEDLFQFGLSGQAKYWLDLPGFDNIHLLAQLHQCRHGARDGRQRDVGVDLRRSNLTPLAEAIGTMPVVNARLLHFTHSSLSCHVVDVTHWRDPVDWSTLSVRVFETATC